MIHVVLMQRRIKKSSTRPDAKPNMRWEPHRHCCSRLKEAKQEWPFLWQRLASASTVSGRLRACIVSRNEEHVVQHRLNGDHRLELNGMQLSVVLVASQHVVCLQDVRRASHQATAGCRVSSGACVLGFRARTHVASDNFDMSGVLLLMSDASQDTSGLAGSQDAHKETPLPGRSRRSQ